MKEIDINTIADVVDYNDLDTLIELLKNKKRQQSAGDMFKNIFNRGYILEIQYDNNCLVYADRLIEVVVTGNTVAYKFGMFGTDGKIAFTLTSKLDDFQFTTALPYAKIYDPLVFNNSSNKTPHTAQALVICKMERGVYDEKATVPVESQALRCLNETRDKVKSAVDAGVASPISQHSLSSSTTGLTSDKTCDNVRVFTPESIKKKEEFNEKKDEEVEKSNPETALEGVINIINNWLSKTNGTEGNANCILVEIDTNKVAKEGRATVTRRNNLSMSFKSLFIDPVANSILFGIDAANSIDDVDSKSWKYKFSDDEKFFLSWSARSGAFIITGSCGETETCKFKIRFMDAGGHFVEDSYKFFSDYMIKFVA